MAFPRAASAGPPFLTDDPVPVDLGHWEFYAASQGSWQRKAASGSLPHFEANFGALPELQVHAIVPAGFSWNRGGPFLYGIGDVELGAKFRFIHESRTRPQIGVFPLVTLPTGSESRGLGSGDVEALVPVWLQKSSGSWTAYGGAAVHIAREGDASILGWLVQHPLSKKTTLGGEAFFTAPFGGGGLQTQINVGLMADLSDHDHILLSAGPSFGTELKAQSYVAYLVTL